MSKTSKFAPTGLQRDQQWITPKQWLKSKGLDAKPIITTASEKFRKQMSLSNKKKNKASSGFMSAVNRQR